MDFLFFFVFFNWLFWLLVVVGDVVVFCCCCFLEELFWLFDSDFNFKESFFVRVEVGGVETEDTGFVIGVVKTEGVVDLLLLLLLVLVLVLLLIISGFGPSTWKIK